MKSKKYKVKIEGVTPLLMHRNAMMDEEVEPVSGGKRGDDRHPADKWKQSLYVEGGVLVWPEANLKAGLEKAGAQIAIGGKKTLKAAAVAGIYFDQVFIPLLSNGVTVESGAVERIGGMFAEQAKQVLALGFKLDTRPATIGTSKHVRVRPRFDAWALEATFDVELQELTAPRLQEMFSICGRLCGQGDWRPSSPKRPGSFGRFTAEVSEV